MITPQLRNSTDITLNLARPAPRLTFELVIPVVKRTELRTTVLCTEIIFSFSNERDLLKVNVVLCCLDRGKCENWYLSAPQL